MRVRLYSDEDLGALRHMHAKQGFDYEFPNLSDPLFVAKLVAEEPDGEPVMAALARLTCETYLLMDPEVGSPRERYGQIKQLEVAGEEHLRRCGLTDAHAWLPPEISKGFGRRLRALGWVRDDRWTPYCKRFV
jgi:hypothetical protein